MGMAYFRLSPDKEAANMIKLEKIDRTKYRYKMNRKDFDQLEPFHVAYYTVDINMEFCDFISQPTFMISEKYRKIFQLLEPSLECKGLQLYPADMQLDRPLPTYWIPYLEETDCIHAQAQFYTTGTIQKLVLKKSAVQYKNLIRAKTKVEEVWLASLTAVESILRRRPLGIHLEIVEVRE